MARTAYQEFITLENFHLAYQRIRRGGTSEFKRYYEIPFSCFNATLLSNLKFLIEEIKKGVYFPEPPIKVHQVKSSGLLRPITILSLKDLIVYQAIINVMAERFRARYMKNALTKNFGNLLAPKGEENFFQNWQNGYAKYNRKLRTNWKRGKKWMAEFDLTAFYDSIDHYTLKQILKEIFEFNDERILYLLFDECLTTWVGNHNLFRHRHGLPQGPQASAFLADCFLDYFDNKFSESKLSYTRYVDDITIQGRTEKLIKQELLNWIIYQRI